MRGPRYLNCNFSYAGLKNQVRMAIEARNMWESLTSWLSFFLASLPVASGIIKANRMDFLGLRDKIFTGEPFSHAETTVVGKKYTVSEMCITH